MFVVSRRDHLKITYLTVATPLLKMQAAQKTVRVFRARFYLLPEQCSLQQMTNGFVETCLEKTLMLTQELMASPVQRRPTLRGLQFACLPCQRTVPQMANYLCPKYLNENLLRMASTEKTMKVQRLYFGLPHLNSLLHPKHPSTCCLYDLMITLRQMSSTQEKLKTIHVIFDTVCMQEKWRIQTFR